MPPAEPPVYSATEEAERLAKTLDGIVDPSVRISWVNKVLDELGAAVASDVVAVVMERLHERDGIYARLLLMVSVALHAEESRVMRRAIARVAAIRKQQRVSNFLNDDEDSLEDARASRVPDFGMGRPVSLGERKSLARRRDRALMDRVLRDPDPDVIRILLDNPALTEDNVIRLCSLRPLASEVLSVVFGHARWVVRYRVRLAIALNPHTPPRVALQILPHLSPADVREVARTAQLSERVRDACQNRPPLETLE